MSDKVDANDVARERGPEGLAQELDRLQAAAAPQSPDVKQSATTTPGAACADDDDEQGGKRPDYRALALDYLRTEGMGEPGADCRLVYWKEDFYQWTGTHYDQKSKAEFDGLLTKFLLTHARAQSRVSKNLIGNVKQNLIGHCILEDAYNPPVWKEKRPPERMPNIVAVQNGLIDLDALVKDVSKYTPMKPTPRLFITAALPFNYDRAAECPKWREMLNRILPDDLQSVLQETGGYGFTLETEYQFFVIMFGEAQTGKSAFLSGLKAALGESNYCELPLSVLQSEKTSNLVPLHNMRANIIEECDEVDKMAENLLKILTGGATVTIDRKFKEALRLTSTAKWYIATNSRPHFKDRTNAIYRRLIVIPFTTVVQESERVYGMDKPGYWQRSGELAGIFNWFVEGLRRLRERGRVLLPPVCEVAKEEYKIDTLPERRFLTEEFIEGEDSIHSHTLYETYVDWMKDEGHPSKMSKQNFGKGVRAVFPRAESKVVSGARHWFGIRRRLPHEKFNPADATTAAPGTENNQDCSTPENTTNE